MTSCPAAREPNPSGRRGPGWHATCATAWLAMLVAVTTCVDAGSAVAATYTWNVTTGTWTDNTAWAPTTSAAGTGPTSADTIVYAGAASQTINLAGATQTASTLTTNALSATSLTLTATNGSLVLSGNANQSFNATSASSGSLTYDFSGLSGFSYNAPTRTFTIGWDVGTATGTTTFNFATQGSGTNTITAQTFQTGGPGNGNFLGLSVINLGKVNTINSSTFAIGGYSNSGTVAFGSGVTNGSLVLRGTAGGTARVDNIYVGQSAAGAGSNRSGSGWLNLTGGSLDARATTTTVGGAIVNNQSINSTGVLTMASGTLDTLTLVVGSKSNVGSPALTATLNQNGGLVLSGTVRFGDITTGSAAAPTFTSIYNLVSGTLGAAIITTQPSLAITATTTANASSVRRIAWSGGTIANYDASTDLTISGTSTNAGYTMQLVLGSTTTPQVFSADSGRTITVDTSAVISGTGLLQKQGDGTLRINTAATYTGSTGINGGTVQLGVANALPTTTGLSMSPSSGTATLDLNGFSQTLASLASSGAGAAVIDVAATGTSTLTVGDGSNTSFAGTLRNSGASALLNITKNGTGTLTLTGTNSSTSGTLAVNNGKVTIDPGAGGSFQATGRLQMLPGAGLSSTLEILSGSNTFGTTLGIAGLSDFSTTGTSTLSIGGGSTTLQATNNRFLIGNKGPATLSVSTGAFTITGGQDVVVGGDLQYTANNATGVVTVSGGTFSITSSGSLALGRNQSSGGTTTGANGTINLDGGVFATARPFTTGGGSGTISFNGGTLRALASSSDFIAVTTANIKDGGAVIDTNMFNITIGQALLNTGTGGLTKINSGTLTLTASNSYTGGTTLNGGVLAFGTNALGSGTVTLNGGTLQWASGNAQDLSPRLGLVSGSTATLDTNGNNVVFATGFGGSTSAALVKTGSGTLTLSASNSYTGGTTLTGGTLQLGNPNALGSTSGGLAVNGGTLDLGGNSVTVGLLTGSSGATITSNTTGSVTLTASSASSGTFAGAITSGSGTVALVKSGGGTLTLSGANTYGGSTTVAGGTLSFGATQALSGGLVLGGSAGATTVGAVDLSSASGTFGALTVQTLSSSTNTITVGSGRNLATNGNVTIGVTPTTSGTSATNLVVAGATAGVGGWSITNSQAAGTFLVGVNTGGSGTANAVTVDLSSLGTFTANLSGANSIFRVGNTSGNNAAGAAASLTLAVSSTVTAKTIGVGYASGETQTFSLYLGSGAQRLNTDSLIVGNGASRAAGQILFAGPTGSLVLRGTNGTGRADVTMVSGNATTSSIPAATIDVRGHDADLLIGTLAMTTLTGNAGNAYASTFSFDQGSLDVTTLTMGSKSSTAAGTATNTATVNLGSSTNAAVNTSTIGSISMASHSGTSSTIRAVFNIAGANTTVTATGSWLVASNYATSGVGVSSGTVNVSGGTVNANQGIVLRSGSGFGTVDGTLNLTGGVLTSGGNITSAGTFGGGSSTLTLNGGRLDMGGFAIGGAGQTVTASFQSGTLSNLGEFNNGAALTKTTSGTLTLSGSSGFAGGTILSAGRLVVGSANALGSAAGSLAVNAGTLDLAGNSVTVGLLTGSSGATITTSAGSPSLAVNSASSGTFAGVISDAVALTKQGVGTLTLTGANTFTGGVTLSGGTLALGSAGALGSSGAISFTGGTLQYSASNTTDYSGRFSGAAGQQYRIDTGNANVTLASAMTSSGGSLVKLGSGTLTLGGANTYDAGTTVSAGRLVGTATSLQGAITNNAAVEFALTANGTYAGVMGGSGSLTKTGAGVLTLTAANSYGGSTIIDAGTLKLGAAGSLASSLIKVSAGAIYDLTNLTGYALGSGQTLAGKGTVLGDVTVAGGATLSPGNSPGTLLQTGNETWGGGGNYNWQLYDSGSTAVAGTGWDFLDVTGTLSIAATGSNPFDINLWTLSGTNPDVNGFANNFNGSYDYAWDFATFSGGISGFIPAAFSVVTSPNNGTGGFLNVDATGMFSVRLKPGDNHTLQIIYAAAPEPSAIVIAGTGAVFAAWLVRRRRARAAA